MGWGGYQPLAGEAQSTGSRHGLGRSPQGRHCHPPHCTRDKGDTTGRCCCQSTCGLDDTIMMILMIIITNY